MSGGGTISASGLVHRGHDRGRSLHRDRHERRHERHRQRDGVRRRPTTVYRINCGSSSAASPFTADQYGSGGTQRTVTNTITISGITNPAPQAVYQSERYGNSTYTLPEPHRRQPVHRPPALRRAVPDGDRQAHVQRGHQRHHRAVELRHLRRGRRATTRPWCASSRRPRIRRARSSIVFTTVTDNATIEGIEIITADPEQSAHHRDGGGGAPNPVSGTTASLSVLGADDGGEANLTYTWATTGTPPAAVTFSANGTNAAKTTTATFTKAGTYTLQVTVKDQPGLTATSPVAVTVNQTLTSIVVVARERDRRAARRRSSSPPRRATSSPPPWRPSRPSPGA